MDDNQDINALYREVLEKNKYIEQQKKQVSSKMLLVKNTEERINFITEFLNWELKRHEITEHIAVIALNNRKNHIITGLQQLYPGEKNGDVLTVIRENIDYYQTIIGLMHKRRKFPLYLSFVERRMVKEITRYVLDQARLYNTGTPPGNKEL